MASYRRKAIWRFLRQNHLGNLFESYAAIVEAYASQSRGEPDRITSNTTRDLATAITYCRWYES
jgi:hypothetical protein